MKIHKIIEHPHTYRIIKFCYNSEANNYIEHYIDIWFQKDTIIRKLRFIAPINLEIEKWFPKPTWWLEILDIKDSQLQDITVQVRDFESEHWAINFYSKDVIDIW